MGRSVSLAQSASWILPPSETLRRALALDWVGFAVDGAVPRPAGVTPHNLLGLTKGRRPQVDRRVDHAVADRGAGRTIWPTGYRRSSQHNEAKPAGYRAQVLIVRRGPAAI